MSFESTLWLQDGYADPGEWEPVNESPPSYFEGAGVAEGPEPGAVWVTGGRTKPGANSMYYYILGLLIYFI